jgi:acetyl-CoA carboxylase carboxyl transferase subunit alpha
MKSKAGTKKVFMARFLDFERPIAELEGKIDELCNLSTGGALNISDEILRLQKKSKKLQSEIYKNISPWQKVHLARHPDRPQFFDYLHALFENCEELCGDRCFAEDPAIFGCLASFEKESVMVIGQQKGQDTESRIKHNFGMPRPEGYRKARRLMELANRFHLPIITFVDTAGAYPGIDAEERGQAEAIAKSIECSLTVHVPLITIIIGEGGSGGAIAIATSNLVYMMEYAVYSVISPEGCASILWKSVDKSDQAAAALKLTAKDLLKLSVIDKIIKEPLGGAHRMPLNAIENVKKAIAGGLKELKHFPPEVLRKIRRDKFLNMGQKILN